VVFAAPPAGWEAHPPHHVKSNATSGPTGFTPLQIWTAYGIKGDGKGQTIAIVDAYDDPSALSDVNVFSTTFSSPLPQFNVGGPTFTKATPQGKPRTDSGWALEISLDVQWAHAIAPQANILLVEAKSASFANLLSACDYAVAHGAGVVSCSWGGGEFSSETQYDSHFNRTGVSFTVSSGDSGAGAQYPAASPYVVAVGGTTLITQSGGTYVSESGWSGSGGGTSAYEAVPSFQSSLRYGRRSIPDVALVADPNTGVSVYDTTGYNGQKGWFTVGGTSAGAPMWAGIIAIANSQRASTLNGVNTALYSLSGTDFHDITSGSNGLPTGAGYDQVTGIGSPKADLLIPHLAAY
jgi:subtilase family serine protease